MEAVPALLRLATMFFAWGVALFAKPFHAGFFSWLKSQFVQFVKDVWVDIKSGNAFAAAMTNNMGKALAKTDASTGFNFHNAATYVRKLGNLATLGTYAIISLAQVVAGKASFANVRHELHRLVTLIRTVEHTARLAIRRENAVARAAAQSVAQGIYPRLRTVENDVAKVLHPEVTAARDLARTAEDKAIAAYRYAKSHVVGLTSAAAVAAVAWALPKLGLNWLRCNSNPFNNNPKACGLLGDLSGLLGIFAAGFALANIEEIVKGAQLIEVDAVKAMSAIVGVEHELFG